MRAAIDLTPDSIAIPETKIWWHNPTAILSLPCPNSKMAFPNIYSHRKVAETSARACEICFKLSTSVLVTPENKVGGTEKLKKYGISPCA